MTDTKEPTFEEAVEKLSAIVSDLEKGDVSLEASIELFGEGTRLVAHCGRLLDEAEQKVAMLSGVSDGEAQTQPFETSERDRLE